MKITRILVLAQVIAVLPAFAAEEKKEKPALPAFQVTLTRTKLSTGEKLDEVTTTSAVVGNELEGTLPVNMGTEDKPRFWTVRFDAAGEGWMQISVMDNSQLREGTHQGTNFVTPVDLFVVSAPFGGEGVVSIYKTKAESLTLEVTPAVTNSTNKTEAK